MYKASISSLFNRFKSSTKDIELPGRFNYPFNYSPHPISILAAKELQNQI